MQYTTETTPTFESFYARYAPLVQRVLSSVCGRYQGYQEDLLQETFVKAWKAYDRLDHLQNVPAWIGLVAKNVARDFLRSRHVHQRLDCSLDEHAEQVLALPDTRLDGQRIDPEMSEAIMHAYQQLRPDDRRVMTLLFQEYTPPEIAAVLNLNRDACRWRIQRARRRFQRYYAEA
jgi:RNA polymerase sigma factor (sigma-70 family)